MILYSASMFDLQFIETTYFSVSSCKGKLFNSFYFFCENLGILKKSYQEDLVTDSRAGWSTRSLWPSHTHGPLLKKT